MRHEPLPLSCRLHLLNISEQSGREPVILNFLAFILLDDVRKVRSIYSSLQRKNDRFVSGIASEVVVEFGRDLDKEGLWRF